MAQPSQVFILDGTPSDFRPIVQVIDDYHRNHKLGAVFETRVGPGKLLVSAFDLERQLEERPAARQLRHSLLSTCTAPDLNQRCELQPAMLENLFGR